jgi:nucleoside-diphosphate-sugar epimerase
MKALVTGSNGFIGSHLVEHLLARGYEVHCLVRTTSNLVWIRDLNVTYHYGDCTEKSSLYEAVRGKDYVYHLAGKIKAQDWETYYRANTEGTKNLIDVCAETNPDVKRFVYISSVSASGPSVRGRMKNESDPCSPVSDYGRTKLLAERTVRKYQNKPAWVILRPSNILGPREYDMIAVFRLLKKRIKPLIGNGDVQTSICFVQDLVRGIEKAALSKKTVHETYFITDGSLYSWRQILDAVLDELGIKRLVIPFPHFMIMIFAFLSEILARANGSETLFTRQNILQLRNNYALYDGSRAFRDFGFSPSLSLETGIRNTVQWCRENRIL